MKRIVALSVMLAAAVVLSGAAFAMGGYGYGGGGMSSMQLPVKRDALSQALSLIRHGQYADAIPHLDRALADRPHSADILVLEGFAHRMTGDFQLSLDFYQKALAEDPDHKIAHENLGELYLAAHDPASARGQLDALSRLCPDGCDARDTLAKSLDAYAAANPPPSPPQAQAPQPQPAAAAATH